MSEYAGKINSLKAALEKAKMDKVKAEQNKENLDKRLEEIETEIKALGVDPAQLEETITNLDTEIQADLLSVEQLIPAQYKQVI